MTAGRRELEGVAQEVGEHLLQASGIAPQQVRGALHRTGHLDAPRLGRRAHRVDGDLDDTGRLDESHLERELTRRDTADVEEVVDQAALVQRVSLDDVERPLGGRLVEPAAP